jgi:hypothetical protein
MLIAGWAVLMAVGSLPAQTPAAQSPVVGSWFGRAVPFNPPCEPGTPGCPIPFEIVMLPTFYADGNFIGIDSNVFVGFHSTAHGGWVETEGDQIESNFMWLQSGAEITTFEGAFRVRLVGRMDPTNRDRMVGYIQAYFFPFVDGPTQRVILDRDNLPVPDPLGQPLPAVCSPLVGCLGTFNFTLRRIKVDRQPNTPPAGLATFTATPNPIVVTDGTGLGQTTVSWIAPTATQVEVRVGAPNGALFVAGGPVGNAQTARWVRDGMTLFLQDVSGGKPLTADHTLARLTLSVRTAP